MPPAGYRVPAAAPSGIAAEMRATSSGVSFTRSAPTFSSSRCWIPRAGYRHHVGALRQHPRQRQLRRRAALLLRNRLDARDQFAVVGEVLLLEARMRGSPPVDIGEGLDRAGQEAAAERRIGDKADAERRASSRAFLPLRRDTAANIPSAPRRSDAPCARGGWFPALPRKGRGGAPCPAPPARHRADGVLDRHATDRRDAGSTGRSRPRRAAAGWPRTPACTYSGRPFTPFGPPGFCVWPNFVASTTRSRRPLIARPMTARCGPSRTCPRSRDDRRPRRSRGGSAPRTAASSAAP